MKLTKRIIAIMLSVMMIFSISHIQSKEVKADTVFSITSPDDDSLLAAGYIDIEWEDASSSATVSKYNVYVDGTLEGSTTSLNYEYYTTVVAYHTTWVEAVYTDGKTATTATVTFGITKKGLGLATDMGAHLSLTDMKLGWYYNWGSTPSSGSQYSGIEYVPMIWTSNSASSFKTSVESLKSQGYKYVLTFNEPDLSNQCNMTVDQVYSVWQGIDDVTGINVGSPVTAIWPSASSWFQTFMTTLDTDNDHNVDFVCIHCYPENYAGSGMAEWFLESVVDAAWEAYHKPIWITEFSTTGSSVTASATAEFWEAVMPGLDEREYVERYAAFGFDSNTVGLWRYSTGNLTSAGQIYASYGNPESEYNVGNATNNNPNGTTTEELSSSTGSSNSSTGSVSKPAKVKIKYAKNKKGKKISVKLKKLKNVSGYQIRWCDNKKFNGYEQKKITKNKCVLKKLDKNTRYFIKARAYVKNGKSKVYGKWSKVKKVRVTK